MAGGPSALPTSYSVALPGPLRHLRTIKLTSEHPVHNEWLNVICCALVYPNVHDFIAGNLQIVKIESSIVQPVSPHDYT